MLTECAQQTIGGNPMPMKSAEVFDAGFALLVYPPRKDTLPFLFKEKTYIVPAKAVNLQEYGGWPAVARIEAVLKASGN